MVVVITGWVLVAIACYLAVGVIFAVPFLAKWCVVLDPGAEKGSFGFRALVFPGVVALWPVLLGKVWKARRAGEFVPPMPERPNPPRRLRAWHGVVVLVLAVWVPGVLAIGLFVRSGPLPHDLLLSPLLPEVMARGNAVIGGQRIVVESRRNSDDWQTRVTVPASLSEPVVALYWAPERADELPRDAVLLGSVWGPADLRFPFPRAGGTLYFVAVTGEQDLLGTVELGGN